MHGPFGQARVRQGADWCGRVGVAIRVAICAAICTPIRASDQPPWSVARWSAAGTRIRLRIPRRLVFGRRTARKPPRRPRAPATYHPGWWMAVPRCSTWARRRLREPSPDEYQPHWYPVGFTRLKARRGMVRAREARSRTSGCGRHRRLERRDAVGIPIRLVSRGPGPGPGTARPKPRRTPGPRYRAAQAPARPQARAQARATATLRRGGWPPARRATGSTGRDRTGSAARPGSRRPRATERRPRGRPTRTRARRCRRTRW